MLTVNLAKLGFTVNNIVLVTLTIIQILYVGRLQIIASKTILNQQNIFPKIK
jgi:hypothetical protein